MTPADWEAVRRIYSEGIRTGQATFETTIPSWAAWSAARRADCRLVIEQETAVVGWAALSPVSNRPAYAGVAEVSLYIAAAWRGQGAGHALLQNLISASEGAGIWTLQAVMFPENEASVALHSAHGFREVGRRERIGRLHGRWRDTVLLERRSAVVGTA